MRGLTAPTREMPAAHADTGVQLRPYRDSNPTQRHLWRLIDVPVKTTCRGIVAPRVGVTGGLNFPERAALQQDFLDVSTIM
jgi:hypothetical protein